MYRRMLVPLDGSELAEVVFIYAKELAGRLNLDVTFLHVCSPDERELVPMHQAYVERVAERVKQESDDVKQKAGGEAGAEAIEARGELAVGYPAEEIIRFADENGIDLILMATHGRSGLGRWALGSVADKVLRASKVPVWLVRAGVSEELVFDKWPQQTILVPLDGSEVAESVLPHVEALAKQRGAERVDVVLLRVCEPPIIPLDYGEAIPIGWERQVEQQTARCQEVATQYVASVQKRLQDAGLKAQGQVLVGRPADVIVDYTNSNPFNLVAMATHGRSGIGRWAYGSVAEKVISGVSCPTFMFRPH
ncbi:MAG: universal stress protein [Chloroflexota bacterium]|nr:universal stress protein [Chloroflexota bacterium]